MSAASTPRARKVSVGSTPSTPLRTSSTNAPASPHYVTTRRHSLYGTEDRVIIDPGSRVWKVGYSGEARPRAVFRVQSQAGGPLWSVMRSNTSHEEQQEEHKLLFYTLQHELRKVFHKSVK